jgi:adenylate cyclase
MARLRFRISVSIVTLISTLIIFTGLIVTGVNYFGSKQSLYFLADDLMEEISFSVLSKTRAYMAPSERNTRLIRFLIQTNYGNETLLLDHFEELLKHNREFNMVYFGDENGHLFMKKRMADNTFSNKFITRKPDHVETIWEHEDPLYPDEFTTIREPLDSGYDPRKRIWYEQAVNAKDLIWTEVYFFASDNQPGISSAMPVTDENGAILGVASIDIGIIELSYFLGSLKLEGTGKAFMINEKNQIISLPVKDEKQIETLFKKRVTPEGKVTMELISIEDIDDAVISTSFASFSEKTRNRDEAIANNLPFSFEHEKKRYLAKYTPFPEDAKLPFTIGVIIPEEDIMGFVYRNTMLVFLISFALVLITLIVGVFFSRSISIPLIQLSREMDKVRNFELDSEREIRTFLIEVDNMKNSFFNMKKGLRSFKKYVPADLVAQLIVTQKEAVLEGKKENLTLFFSDIAGFTTISEFLKPEDLVDQLGNYFEVMSRIILDQKGTLDKYIGDAIMAFWGAPIPVADHAEYACLAALKCQRALLCMQKENCHPDDPFFHTRIGIHTGEAIVGNMGYEDRFNYTAIGDSVNLASRIEGLNKVYGTRIIITESTYQEVKDRFEARLLDRVAVKGKTRGIDIYELFCEKRPERQNVSRFAGMHNRAMQDYFDRNWQQAIDRFERIRKIKAGDRAAALLIRRCRGYLKDPPPPDWNGIHVMRRK